MSLIMLGHIKKAYGAKILFSDITLNINRGEKIGFIGNNGTGKTTLFRIISGEETPDSGEISVAKTTVVGYVAQEMNTDTGNTVYEEVSQPFAGLYKLRLRMKHLEAEIADNAQNGACYDRALKEYDALSERAFREGAYDFEYQIEWVLKGLRISEESWERPVSSFSGGEKNRIALARELVKKPDVLMLDEPANHLDFEGMQWLEEFIRNYEGTVIVISHNRYLLDMCINKIWSLEKSGIREFTGNYSDFRAAQLEEMLRKRIEHDENAKKVERMNFTIQRLRSWGMVYDNPGLVKRAKAMERRRDKIEDDMESAKISTRRIKFSLKPESRSGDIVLNISDYSKSFGDKILFQNTSLDLYNGDKVALLGPNGSGKTTLLEEILHKGSWENPDIRVGKSVKIGYYSQMHQTLSQNGTVLSEISGVTGGNENEAKKVLRSFMFREDDFEKRIVALSGGEKARVQLAKLFLERPNFLILDEPTNHLDISSREVVEEALEEFEGSILVVSHDRYFLDKVIDRLVHIENHNLKGFGGNFTSWWQTRRKKEFAVRREENKDKKKVKAPSKKEEDKLLNLEKEIELLESEKQQIEYEMTKNLSQRGKQHSVKNLKDLKKVTEKLELLYKNWETLVG